MEEALQCPDMTGRPVKIVDFHTPPDGELYQLQITPELEPILAQSGDRPIGILCITGPKRTGKSLMLTYMMKYLSHISKLRNSQNPGQNDRWLHLDQEAGETLTNLNCFEWRNGLDITTTGMWLWSKPFTLTYPREDLGGAPLTFDLYLMDTQGIFDDQTGDRECNMIIGLSLVMSSTLIFNQMRELDSNIIKCLESYFALGTMACNDVAQVKGQGQGQSSSDQLEGLKIQFEKLVFLIRDWRESYARKYSYGLDGGSDYLNQIFNSSTLKEENRIIREKIRQSFHQIQCCPLPEPGKVVDEDDFAGDVSKLPSIFVDQVKSFIEAILNPFNFPLMALRGRKLKGSEVFRNFQMYVNMFNQLPSFQSLRNVYQLTLLDSLVQESCDIYREQMTLQMAPGRFYHFQEISSIFYSSACDSAIQHFQKSCPFCSPENVVNYLTKLKAELNSSLKKTCDENAQFLQKSIGESTQNFEEILRSKWSQGVFFLEEDFKQLCESARAEALKMFVERCGWAQDAKYMDEVVAANKGSKENFMGLDNFIVERARLNNENVMLKVTQDLTKKREKIIKECLQSIKEITGFFTARFLPCKLLQHLQQILLNSAKEKFLQDTARYPSSFIENLVKELESILVVKFESLAKESTSSWEREKKAILDRYEQFLKNNIGDDKFLGDQKIQTFYQQQFDLLAVQRIENLEATLKAPQQNAENLDDQPAEKITIKFDEDYLSILKSDFEDLIQQLKTEVDPINSEYSKLNMAVKENFLEERVQILEKEYQQDLETNFSKHDLLTVEQMNNLNVEIKSTILVKLQDKFPDENSELLNSFQTKLESKMVEIFEQEVIKRQQQNEQFIESEISKSCNNFFVEVLKKVQDSPSVDQNFSSFFEQANSNSSEVFSKVINILPESDKEKWTTQLKGRLETAQKEFLSNFKELVTMPLEIYNNEMIRLIVDQKGGNHQDGRRYHLPETISGDFHTCSSNLASKKVEEYLQPSTHRHQFRTMLVKRMESSLTNHLNENHKFLQGALQDTNDLYQKTMKESIGLALFVSDEEFEQICAKSSNSAMNSFLQKCGQSAQFLQKVIEELSSTSNFLHQNNAFKQERRLSNKQAKIDYSDTFKLQKDTRVQDYNEKMHSLLEQYKFLPTNLLQHVHNCIKKQIVDSFLEESKLKIPLADAEHGATNLDKSLSENFPQFKNQSQKNWEMEKSRMIKKYRAILKKNVDGVGEKFVKDDKLASLCDEQFQKQVVQTVNKFQTSWKEIIEQFPLEDPNSLTSDSEDLINEVKAEIQQVNSEFSKINLTEQQKHLHVQIEELQKQFNENLAAALSASGILSETQVQANADVKKDKIMTSLRNSCPSNDKNILAIFERKLEAKMAESYGRLAEERSQKNNSYIQEQISKYLQSYKTEVEQHKGVNRAQFTNWEKQAADNVMARFQPVIQSLSESAREKWRLDLKSKIELARILLFDAFTARANLLTQDLQKCVEESLQQYCTLIKQSDIMTRGIFSSDESEFRERHKKASDAAIELFDEQSALLAHNCKSNFYDVIRPHRQNLIQQLEQKLEELSSVDSRNREKFSTDLQNVIMDTTKSYNSKLNFDAENEAVFKKGHQTAGEFAVTEFQSKLDEPTFNNLTSAFKKELISAFKSNKLATFLDDAVEEFQERDAERNIAIKHCFELLEAEYNNKMKRYMESKNYHKLHEFEQKHNEICKVLIQEKIINAKVNLSETGRGILEKDLHICFEGYKKEYFAKFETTNLAIGIDLGTTNSCVALYDRHQNGLKANVLGIRSKKIVPSYVYFDKSGSIIVGDLARDKAETDPSNTVFEAKRLIGRHFDDQHVQGDIELWPFKVVKDGSKNEPRIEIREKLLQPHEVSAKVLQEMKAIADESTGRNVTHAVITVPAYFNQDQREKTIEAGKAAGLHVLEIISEPTAAITAYSLEHQDANDHNILVFDLGGGTFDISIVHLTRGNVNVLGTGGDTHLGGGDFDNRLAIYCLDQFKIQHPNITIETNWQKAKTEQKRGEILYRTQRLKKKCEAVKIELSKVQCIPVIIGYFADDDLGKPIPLEIEVTRSKFEEINQDLFDQCISVMNRTVDEAHLKWRDISKILLVGGSTLVPKIQEMIRQAVGPSIEILGHVNRDEVVACGAAIQAAILNGEHQAVKGLLTINDVTAQNIGIMDASGDFHIFIEKNTKIPHSVTQTRATAQDQQTEVAFNFYQGREPIAVNNHFLGEFVISNVPAAPEGEEKFHVCMNIDKNGVLTIHAKSTKHSNLENKITIRKL